MAVLYIRDKITSEFIPINTIQGSSAYQIAVKNGFIGTEEEWLASLKKDTFLYGYNSVTTLASLPISKRLIVASVSASTDISLASDLEIGQELLICLTASADITQPIPTSGGFTSMDGDSISVSSGGYAKISILCIGTSTYIISTKVAS